MAAARLAVGAAAPFVFAATMEKLGIASALFANALPGTIGIAAFITVAASECLDPPFKFSRLFLPLAVAVRQMGRRVPCADSDEAAPFVRR
ncbi:hypothetical protein ACVII0_005931 [Sinorhizobium meliloti]